MICREWKLPQSKLYSFLKAIQSLEKKKGRQSRIVGGEKKKTPLNQRLKIHRRKRSQRTPK
jgi:hypothetical protein